ncbi:MULTISPECIES: hypothetical protein [Pseudomonas]|uniref:hypothetical protein n=1 Tax=Pseudomonas TaxID=286 RepID=UPI001F3BF574|nr:hypothetical protein [Pseudomonas tohonis]
MAGVQGVRDSAPDLPLVLARRIYNVRIAGFFDKPVIFCGVLDELNSLYECSIITSDEHESLVSLLYSANQYRGPIPSAVNAGPVIPSKWLAARNAA